MKCSAASALPGREDRTNSICVYLRASVAKFSSPSLFGVERGEERVVLALLALRRRLDLADLALQAVDLRLLRDELLQEPLVRLRRLRDDLQVLAQPGLVVAHVLQLPLQ